MKSSGIDMKFEIVTDIDRFNKIKEPFNELVSATEVDHVFFKHEYYRCFLTSHDLQDKLFLVTGWRDGQLVAVAPLMKSSIVKRGVRFSVLASIHSGLFPRTNLLSLKADDLRQLLDCAIKNCSLDIVDLRDLEDGIETTDRIVSYLSENHSNGFVKLPSKKSPYIETTGSWEDYLKAQSRNRRRFLKNRIDKKLAECDDYTIELIRSSENYEKIEEAILKISESSWKAETGSSITMVEKQKKFYREFTPLGLDHGWVHIWMMTVNSEPVAFEYYLNHSGSYSGIRSDYDQRFAGFYPGDAIKRDILKFLFASEKHREYDMGGVITPYKMRWTSTVRDHSNIMIGGQSLKGKALVFAMKNIRPLVKRIRPDSDGEN